MDSGCQPRHHGGVLRRQEPPSRHATATPFRLLSLVETRSTDRAQTLTALAVNSATSLVAGLTLAALTDTFQRIPGLLVLVPAAIGLRGNVFSALGSRLSTAIHTGTFSRPAAVAPPG